MNPEYRFHNGFILIFLLILGYHVTSAQGRLLLVGGGPEKNGTNSWSTPPYRWAVEGKRVAIIGTETGSLAPYMTSQCGAAFAKEFAIATRDSADSQITYDTLLTYQVIFFRGGDQWEYYNLYRDTRLQDAVNYIYNKGGCIGGTSAGMHILSSIAFTAENGTVYSYECIENPNNQYVTLENDFFDLQPGFIYDTHFAERARFGRLVGFLANYKLNLNQDILGLGMDDMTCMTVDENGLGTVFGTGCANFYRSCGNFSQNGNKLLADSVEVIQLLKGSTYDFQTSEINYSGLDRQINTSGQSETGNYIVLASGSNFISDNLTMLTDLVSACGSPPDEVLILSGDATLANSFKLKILEYGASDVVIFDPTSLNGSNTELAGKMQTVKKIIFIKNNETTFSQFLQTPNGILLRQKLQSDGMISAFAGEDARFAGKTIIGNYLEYLASWYGDLTFTPGLGLLRNSVIMPQTFLNSDIYENTATAIPYAMARDTIRFGIWLTNHNYMKFSPVEDQATLTGYGTAPVMVIANTGNLAGFSVQTGNGLPGDPRMVAGFEKLSMDFIDYTTPYVMGIVKPTVIHDPVMPLQTTVFPNPVTGRMKFNISGNTVSWSIRSIDGRLIRQELVTGIQVATDVSGLEKGVYILEFTDKSGSRISGAKFIKE